MNSITLEFAYEFLLQKIWTEEDFSDFVRDAEIKAEDEGFMSGKDYGWNAGYTEGASANRDWF